MVFTVSSTNRPVSSKSALVATIKDNDHIGHFTLVDPRTVNYVLSRVIVVSHLIFGGQDPSMY